MENCPLPSQGQLGSYDLQEDFSKVTGPVFWLPGAPRTRGHLTSASCVPCARLGASHGSFRLQQPLRQAVLSLSCPRGGHPGSMRLSQWPRLRGLESQGGAGVPGAFLTPPSALPPAPTYWCRPRCSTLTPPTGTRLNHPRCGLFFSGLKIRFPPLLPTAFAASFLRSRYPAHKSINVR